MRSPSLFFSALVFTTLGLAAPSAVQAAEAPASEQFPREAKPWCYWWWMGSAVDPENIRHELRRYHDAGLGGVHIIPIYGVKGYEDRYIDYLSPKWMGMLKVTVEEAAKLDMGVDMTLGTGWCFGGPQIPPPQACLRPAVKVTDVAAGQTFTARLDPAQLQAVVAYPAGAEDGNGGKEKESGATDLTGRVKSDGSLSWQAPAAAKVYVLTASWQKGIKVKRAAPGGQGYMLNPFYRPSAESFLVPFTKAFDAYDGLKPRAVYQDSYEYNSAWSPDLLAEFEKRRGYRLQDHLPEVFGEAQGGDAGSAGNAGDAKGGAGGAGDDAAARVKHDLRETVSDLMVDHFYPTWMDWARRRGFLVRDEAHGSPGNWLDLYAQADVPETEMFHKDRDVLVAKFASSAAHVAGRKLTGAETGTWLAEHFTVTLGEMKGLIDEMFLGGVNHIFYHGTCYSPDDAAWPGWCFYASTEMNPRNSIWHDVGAVNAYAARCQQVLQAGRPDNDVLLYWPVHDYWQDAAGLIEGLSVGNANQWLRGQPVGKTAQALWEKGYAFDYVSDRQLAAAKARDGQVEVPGGTYRAVVVPPTKAMPPATLRALLALADAGAVVIFEGDAPAGVPGLDPRHEGAEELRKALAPLRVAWEAGAKAGGGAAGANNVESAAVGKGRALQGDLGAALAAAGVRREALTDAGCLFVRRKTDAGRDYFIVNRGEKRLSTWLPLAAIPAAPAAPGAGQPAPPAQPAVELLDPMTGRAGAAPLRVTDGVARVFVQLDPGQSIIVRSTAAKPGGRAWVYHSEPDQGQPVPLGGEWHVTFIEGGPELPPAYKTDKLGSWASQDGEAAQRFAGTAAYTTTFDAPPGAAGKPAESCWLDLGTVAQSARVRVNGEDLGTLVSAPFRVAAGHLRPTGNTLRVEVTNVSANRIRDLDRRGVKWKIFNDINVVNIDYKPFDASNWPLTDSGLIGPVTLRPAAAVTPQ